MIESAILGHCIGDAMGVPFEMTPRKYLKEVPVEGMERKINRYSDDTAMTLATMQSIIKNKGINYDSMMYEFYLWLAKGKYTQNKKPYGYGNTTFNAIYNYSIGIDALECGMDGILSNGNGVLMRMLPIVFYLHQINANDEKVKEVVKNTTILTHSHEINVLGTYIFVKYCLYLLEGNNKFDSYKKIQGLDYSGYSKEALSKYKRILKDDISKYQENKIKSGIAIFETLEAVLWSILTTNNYREALLTAINLGGDADTIGAITGGVAGMLYNDIPIQWVKQVEGYNYIYRMIRRFKKVLSKIKD